MKKYNIALVGCGHMGQAHLEHIYCKENVCVSYVCDSNENRAREFQRRFGAKNICTDAFTCISAADVDIVILATYPSSHVELLKLCLQQKKHVICEKPIAKNPEDGMEFARLVKENPDVKVLVGYILRHNETYQRVAQMIHNGAIGKPIVMRMTQNHHTMDWSRYRRLLEETPPIVDCGVHYLDVMQWFTGATVTELSGVGLQTEADLPAGRYNYEIVSVKLSDGSVGFYEAGWTKTITSDNTKEFVGPLGSIRLVFAKDRTSHQEEGDLIEYYELATKTYHTINVPAKRKPTDLQLEHLIRMIEEDVPAWPTIDEVCSSFKAAWSAERQIQNRT